MSHHSAYKIYSVNEFYNKIFFVYIRTRFKTILSYECNKLLIGSLFIPLIEEHCESTNAYDKRCFF